MPMPPTDPETLCEDLVPDGPLETMAMAYELQAVRRGRTITTPQPFWRVVLVYGGLEQRLREVAGTMTLLGPRLTASALAARLAAWRAWGKALLPQMRTPHARGPLPHGRRCLVMDGSPVHAPGAPQGRPTAGTSGSS